MRLSLWFSGAMVCVAMAACGGDSPGAPTPTVIPTPAPPAAQNTLVAGRYSFTLSAGLNRACTGRLDSWGLVGPSIFGGIRLSADGDAWVGRPEFPEDGDLEVRIRRGSAAPLGEQISGEIRGAIANMLDRFFSSPPRSVVIGGNAATIEGVMLPAGPGVSIIGTAAGEFTFRHTAGTTATCAGAQVSMTGPH
jgi:hypothetical protein